MKITTTTTKCVEMGSGAMQMAVVLNIGDDYMIQSIECDGESYGIEWFDRVAKVIADHREQVSRYPHYVTAPKCCADHGHYDGYLCPKCEAEEKTAQEATTNEGSDK